MSHDYEQLAARYLEAWARVRNEDQFAQGLSELKQLAVRERQPDAAMRLAVMYRQGQGVPQCDAHVRLWLNIALQLKHPFAAPFELFCDRSYRNAAAQWRRLDQQWQCVPPVWSTAHALGDVAVAPPKKVGRHRYRHRRRRALLPALPRASVSARGGWRLEIWYYLGVITKWRSLPAAVEWFSKAARVGHAASHYRMHEHKCNEALSALHLNQAAQQGFLAAYITLGCSYWRADSWDQCAFWFKRAALRGSWSAYSSLASLLRCLDDCTKPRNEALSLELQRRSLYLQNQAEAGAHDFLHSMGLVTD